MNCLSSANIKLLYELCTKSEARMLKFRNFGHKSLEEIKEKIKGLGLVLDMQLSDRLVAALDAEAANVRAESEENK
jgi:DNA-directed RNA polymerase subunit alpha